VTATRIAALMAVVAVSLISGGCAHERIVVTVTAPSRPVTSPVPAPAATAPLAGRPTAELDVVSDFDSVTVRIGPISDDLFRAATPAGSSAAAAASVTGNVVAVSRRGTAGSGPAVLEVTLNPIPAWRLVVRGSAGAADVDLSAGRARGVDLGSGIGSATVTLPVARGTTRLGLAGGANQLRVHLRGPAPVRVTLTGGAGTVSVDREQRSGVGEGTVLASPGWATAADRYDIACRAGVADLTVDRGP
jgi:hypothetical protein